MRLGNACWLSAKWVQRSDWTARRPTVRGFLNADQEKQPRGMKCESGILICLSVSLRGSVFQALWIPSPTSTRPHPQTTCTAENNFHATHCVISNDICQPLAQSVVSLKMHRTFSKEEQDSNSHYILTEEHGHAPSLRRQVGLRPDQWVSEQLLEPEVAPESKPGWWERLDGRRNIEQKTKESTHGFCQVFLPLSLQSMWNRLLSLWPHLPIFTGVYICSQHATALHSSSDLKPMSWP